MAILLRFQNAWSSGLKTNAACCRFQKPLRNARCCSSLAGNANSVESCDCRVTLEVKSYLPCIHCSSCRNLLIQKTILIDPAAEWHKPGLARNGPDRPVILGTASGPRRWIGRLRLHAGKYILGVTAPTGTGVQALPRSILSRVLSTHAAGHGTRLLKWPNARE